MIMGIMFIIMIILIVVKITAIFLYDYDKIYYTILFYSAGVGKQVALSKNN